MTRRQFLIGSSAIGGALLCTGGYAGIIEPGFRLVVTEYRLNPPRWPRDFSLNIAVIADPHASEPYMSASRIENIVETVNTLKPDLVVLLGDFEASHRFVTKMVPSTVCKQVPYTVCKQVPYTVCVKVPYTVTECVPTDCCKKVKVCCEKEVCVRKCHREPVCVPVCESEGLFSRLFKRHCGCEAPCGCGNSCGNSCGGCN